MTQDNHEESSSLDEKIKSTGNYFYNVLKLTQERLRNVENGIINHYNGFSFSKEFSEARTMHMVSMRGYITACHDFLESLKLLGWREPSGK